MNEQSHDTYNHRLLDSYDGDNKVVFQFSLLGSDDTKGMLTEKTSLDDGFWDDGSMMKKVGFESTNGTEDSSSCSSECTFVDDPNYDSNNLLLQYCLDEDEDNDFIDGHDCCIDNDELYLEDDDDNDDNNQAVDPNVEGCADSNDDDSLDILQEASVRSDSSTTISCDTSASENDGSSRLVFPAVYSNEASLSQVDRVAVTVPATALPTDSPIQKGNQNDVDGDNESDSSLPLNTIASRKERRDEPNWKDLSKSAYAKMSGSSSRLRKVRSSSPQPKQVRFFDAATVREYALTVGAYSYVADTCPLQLSWEHSPSKRIPLKDVMSPRSTGGGGGGATSTLRRLTIEERRNRIASIQGIATDDVCNDEYKSLLDMIKSTQSDLNRTLVDINRLQERKNARKFHANKFHDSWPCSGYDF